MSRIPRELLIVMLVLLCGNGLRAETRLNPTTADELKQLNDPTLLVTHLSLETEWDRFKDGAERANWTFTGLWGWRVSECQDWAIRFNLPFVYDRSDRASGHHDTGGLGDAEFGAGTAIRLNDKWRTAAGVELHADTASDSAFAENVWRLKWGCGVAHDFTDWFSLTANAEYNHSIAEQDDVRSQSYLDMAVPATFILPQHWSVSTKYRTVLDFNNGGRWMHTLTAGIAKRLKIPIVLSTTIEKPLSSGAKTFQVGVTAVYYF